MHYYESLKVRREQERKHLEMAESEQARAMIQKRLSHIKALMAEHQSQYNVPQECYCLR